ncbi:unnamed protein product [Urochloa humidicola]
MSRQARKEAAAAARDLLKHVAARMRKAGAATMRKDAAAAMRTAAAAPVSKDAAATPPRSSTEVRYLFNGGAVPLHHPRRRSPARLCLLMQISSRSHPRSNMRLREAEAQRMSQAGDTARAGAVPSRLPASGKAGLHGSTQAMKAIIYDFIHLHP